MKFLLNYLRKDPETYVKIANIYGKTLGFYWFKEWYVKNIGFWNGQKRVRLVDDKKADKMVSKKIKSKKRFMVARYGSTEFRNLTREGDFELLCFNSGFFPNDKRLLKKFREIYFKSSKDIDFLCIWNYRNHFLKKIKWIKNFKNITCFFDNNIGHERKWIKDLKNKKILIIHPFKKTIEYQYKRMDKLKILPKLKKLEIIKAVQTVAGTKDDRFKTWFDALNYMKREIDKKDFDIALIGCGAYGLPLASYVKQKGKQAIHVGGGLQLFFGIKGKRWDDICKIKTNKYWIRPLKEDIISNYKNMEGSAYW